MATPSKKRKELPLDKKIELIKDSDNGKSQRQLAEIYLCGKTTVQKILAKRRDYEEAFEENVSGSRKRIRSIAPNEELNALMWEWYIKITTANVPLTGPLIQEKALQIAAQLKITDFKASNGWLYCFCRRNNIHQVKFQGERGSVDQSIVDSYRTHLPSLVKGYQERDIYNMDESGLFWRALSDKTLAPTSKECAGGKRSKERITVSLCCNMIGEFEKAVVIGKSARPRAFKNIKKLEYLPVTWLHNKKAWMTTALFTQWVKGFDRRMRTQGRKVILFLDNAPVHPKALHLTNVKLQFFPPNTTSMLQPLDQGIIQCLKLKYRTKLMRHTLQKVDYDIITNVKDVPKHVSMLDAVKWTASSQREILATTVKKCFLKAGFPDNDAATSIPEEVPLDTTQLSELCAAMLTELELPAPMTGEEFVAFDESTAATDELPEDWEQQLVDNHNTQSSAEDEEDEEDEDEAIGTQPYCSYEEALEAIQRLQMFNIARGLPSDMLHQFESLENQLRTTSVEIRCQASQGTLDAMLIKK
jgi:hypothetical protein